MKKDQYIPHEVHTRNTNEVVQLIEKEGMAGYGIYWALMEYLRAQDDYTGDIRALKSLARQLKTSIDRLLRILKNYGLFEVTDFTFRSRKLEAVMKPLEDKRKAMKARSCDDRETTVQRKAHNSLEIKDGSSLSKVKESKVSSSSKEDDVVAAVPVSLAWERYVDELAKEQTWIELMAMRSGLGEGFVHRFGEVLKHFKQHIQSLGNEKDIQSPSDAKRYFCFFNTPGSVTFRKLVDELQKPVDKGEYKFEDRNPTTGQRSYCGVPIPADAPPRPNSQAVWCKDKWVY
jgi:hypothetical protein